MATQTAVIDTARPRLRSRSYYRRRRSILHWIGNILNDLLSRVLDMEWCNHNDGYGHPFTSITQDNTFIIASVFASSGGYVDETAGYRVGSNRAPNVPSDPNPENGATDVIIDPTLTWDGTDPDWFDSLYFDVYFEKDDSTPDVLVSDDQTGTSYNPGNLELESNYYWQIIVHDEYGLTVQGPIWHFTTRGNSPPNIPKNPNPTNGATNIPLNPTLSWNGGDPDRDKCYYDVYFEVGNPNPTTLVPGCCTPGTEGCPAKSLDDTYGLDWCPGDETLLQFVGKPGYRDPACAGTHRRLPFLREENAMTLKKRLLVGLAIVLLASCVTVNIYFPAAAIQKAADQIVDDVRKTPEEKPEQQPGSNPGQTPEKKSAIDPVRFLAFGPATVHAAVDVNVSTPAIRALKASMANRFPQLQPLYAKGLGCARGSSWSWRARPIPAPPKS